MKKLPWEDLEVSYKLLVKLKDVARFRLFTHTERDLVVAGGMSGGIFFDKGECSFSRGEKCSQDSQIRRSCNQKESRLGFEPTAYGSNFRPIVNSHWRAGRLSRGIVHMIHRML